MVKADYKRDYYADLDLPNTADPELIKKRFRELAKQYHPDRNPGREVDVVPKFQAIQAAHEILGDAIQKAKYDLERAKLNRPREAESPTYKKPPPPRRTDSGHPNGAYPQPSSQPPPRRDASASRYAQQNGARTRPQSTSSTSADKFAQFARAQPSWDRTRFEQESRAEGLRGLNAMRGGQPSQTSPLRSRHPTAPRNAGADPYSPGAEPSPGFPGLNRATSQRRGYGTHAGASEEPAPRSAYAQYHRPERDRPPSAGLFPNAEPQMQQRQQESVSPLRPTRSSQPNDSTQLRPGLSRNSSKYATAGGEKTQINTANISRSASVRNSPKDHKWEERGPFGVRSAAEDRTPRPRHRSHSPQARNGTATFTYASDTSSSDESDTPPRPVPQNRKKASIRRPYTHSSGSETPGLTGYFPNTNYTRVVDDSNTYDYPAPNNKATPVRKPFTNMTSPVDQHDPSANEPSFYTSSQDEAPRHHSSSHPSGSSQERPKFSAEEWHDHFDNHADIFNPPEAMTRDRKSPTKTSRTNRTGPSRSFVPTKDGRRDAVNGDIDSNIAAGVRHVDPGEMNTKAAAFQSGRLAPDFANKVNASRRGSKSAPTVPPASTPGEPDIEAGDSHSDRPTPDEMDVDSPAAPDSESAGSSVNVTVEEEQSPTSTGSNPPPHQRTPRRHSESRANGFNLNDLKQAGPFGPSNTGLRDLDDLANSLPYQSRPAEQLNVLHRTNSSTLRHLNLPRPPKIPHCPADYELNQDSWRRFGDAMTAYMHDWTKFNAAMIEHFRARQEDVTHGMYRNWVSAHGDGATAEDFEASGGSDKAGYATYMTWLEDDRKCRTWWDVAFEEHRVCLEGLGRVRKKIKEMSTRRG